MERRARKILMPACSILHDYQAETRNLPAWLHQIEFTGIFLAIAMFSLRHSVFDYFLDKPILADYIDNRYLYIA